MDQNLLIARLDTYCQKYHVSNNKAAAGIGYTASVLSQWRKGEYRGDCDAVTIKVAAWLDLQESREEAGAVPRVDLRRTRRMKETIRVAHEEQFIALVLGDSGAGKSFAIDEYVAQNPGTAITIKCDPTMGLSTIVASLARGLGLDTKGRLAEISDRLVDELRRRDMVVIFDEADYLSDSVMEWARIVINDKGQSALVFAGQPRFEHRIKGLRGDHRQIENRVGVRLHIESVSEADTKDVLDAVWPSLADEVVKVFAQTARQSLHLLVRHIALVKRALRSDGLILPDAELATESAGFLMR